MSDLYDIYSADAEAHVTPRQREYLARKEAKASATAMKAIVRMAEAGPQGRKQIEKQRLAIGYRRYRAKKFRMLLAGDHGRDIMGLRQWIRRLPVSEAPALILAHLRSLTWVTTLLGADRLNQISTMIDAAMQRLRARAGLPPIDDQLPDGLREDGVPECPMSIIKARFDLLQAE